MLCVPPGVAVGAARPIRSAHREPSVFYRSDHNDLLAGLATNRHPRRFLHCMWCPAGLYGRSGWAFRPEEDLDAAGHRVAPVLSAVKVRELPHARGGRPGLE